MLSGSPQPASLKSATFMTSHPTGYAAHLLEVMQSIAQGQMRFDGDEGDGISTTRWSFLSALEMLAAREQGGLPAADSCLASIRDLLEELLPAALDDADRRQLGLDATPKSLEEAEAAAFRSLSAAEVMLTDGRGGMDCGALKALCDWEVRQWHAASRQVAADSSASAGTVSISLLSEYLRARLNEPSLTVTDLKQLRGGFHKETYLFTVEAGSLAGELVMRRDSSRPLITNACHRVRKEFEVLKVLQEERFMSPAVLWVDTEHERLPGADFIIMRRSEGVCGGTLFGASQPVDPAFNDQIGAMLARLHTLAPLTRLGALTEAIRPEMWSRAAKDLVKEYLDGFRQMLLTTPHSPSPATIGILTWLIAHVPEDNVRPCLVHGDVGFHNLLIADGRLTTLLDWERAHIGHPAEDVAYLFNAAAGDLDWARVMRAYRANGGIELSERDLLFFRIMMLARNAVSLNVGASRLLTGEVKYLRLLVAENFMRPRVLASIAELIDEYGKLG